MIPRTVIQNLRSSVDKLNPTELDEVIEACLLRKHKTDTTTNRNDQIFYQALERALATIGHKLSPYHVFAKQPLGKNLHAAVAKIDDFVRRAVKSQAKTWDFAAAYGIIAYLLLEDVRRLQIPVGPKTLLEAVDRLASIFDDAFPGYVASGLAGRILQKRS